MKSNLKRILTTFVIAAFAVSASAGFASAGSNEGSAGLADIVVPTGTVKEGVRGDVVFLASQSVRPELQGGHCQALVTPMNNESPREGSDINVVSASTITEPNVESKENYVPKGPQLLELGETITVSVTLGEHPQPGDPNHGAFSGGVTVSFSDCHAPPVLIRVCRDGISQDIPQEAYNPATDTPGDCLPQCEHSSNFGQTNPECPAEPPATVDIDTAISVVRPATPVSAAPRTTG